MISNSAQENYKNIKINLSLKDNLATVQDFPSFGYRGRDTAAWLFSNVIQEICKTATMLVWDNHKGRC